MADILVRDLAPKLKADIKSKAKAHGRSLSEEAKHLLRLGLEAEMRNSKPANRSALQAMEAAFAECSLSDEEQAQFERDLEESRQSEWLREEPAT